jgi:hypothetical protein
MAKMAEATKEPDVLTFVKKNYDKLKSEAQSDNNPVNGDVTAVIKLIDDLYQTIKNPDATHDTIVGQLKPLQTAYDELNPLLSSTEYVSYNEANNRLKRIIDVTGVEEEKEEETEEEEEEEGEEEEGEEEEE